MSVSTYHSSSLHHRVCAAYEEYKLQLQILQWQRGGGHWVLKSPLHLNWLDALLTTFPDACVVQTHRDPMRVMASLSSLACLLHSAFSDHIDARKTAAVEVEHYAEMLETSMQQRAAIETNEGAARFFDVQFEDILGRPLEVIEQLYDHFGFEWSDDTRDRMHRYLQTRPRDKHGTHKYTLEEFGLSTEQHGPLFADYCKRFGIQTQ